MEPSIQNILDFIKGDYFVIVDGGARNGTKEVPRLHPFSCIFAFEPSQEEFLKLKNQGSPSVKPGTIINYPVALTKHDGEVTLNITLRPGATSTLIPNEDFFKHFQSDHWSEMSQVVEKVDVPAMRLDTFMKKNDLKYIDLLKLDTQGNELDILESAGAFIDGIEVIRTEVEFVSIYKHQPLFHDVSAFLHKHGFEFLDLQWSEPCKRFHARSDLGPDAYRLIWGDAVFVRTPYDFQKERLLPQAIVLGEMGYRDLAIYQIRNSPRLSKQDKQKLEDFYVQRSFQPNFKRRIRELFIKKFGIKIDRCGFDKQVVSMKDKTQ